MQKKLELIIPARLVKEPIIFKMMSTYHLKPNIQEAHLEPVAGGKVILELEGSPMEIEKGILYLKEHDISITELD